MLSKSFNLARRQALAASVFGQQQSVAAALLTPVRRSFALQARKPTRIFGTPARGFATTQNVPSMGDSISEGVVQEFVKRK